MLNKMEKIRAVIIIEMMGKPADYLNETLSKFVSRMELEKGVKIINKKINKSKKVPDSELLSSFAEVEIEFDTLQHLLMIIFTYMPSHIEIISPEEIRLRNFEISSLCNDLTRRMLEYDSIAKKMIYEKRILENQLRGRGMTPAITEDVSESKPVKDKKKTEKKTKRKVHK